MWSRQQETCLLHLQNPVIGYYVRLCQSNSYCCYNSYVLSASRRYPNGLFRTVYRQNFVVTCHLTLSRYVRVSRTPQPMSSTHPTYNYPAHLSVSSQFTLYTSIPHSSTYLPRSSYIRVSRTPQPMSSAHSTYEYPAHLSLLVLHLI
jgi:hypothetical protein